MTQTEALRLALEALEMSDICADDCKCTRKRAITAIEAALEAKDEPVAWISPTELLVMRGNALGGAKDWRVNVGLKPEDGDVGLYTAPPQRKPLTDEEVIDIGTQCQWYDEDCERFDSIGFARAIEAAHGIKGEA